MVAEPWKGLQFLTFGGFSPTVVDTTVGTMAERGVKVDWERNKEGTPSWDGDPVTFTEYSEMAGHWEQSVVHHKRYFCGPKLQAELTGTARRFVMSMKPGWCSHNGGVTTLLNHLRRHLGQPQLSEMSDYMARYFKNSKRRRNENMNDYITRKAETISASLPDFWIGSKVAMNQLEWRKRLIPMALLGRLAVRDLPSRTSTP